MTAMAEMSRSRAPLRAALQRGQTVAVGASAAARLAELEGAAAVGGIPAGVVNPGDSRDPSALAYRDVGMGVVAPSRASEGLVAKHPAARAGSFPAESAEQLARAATKARVDAASDAVRLGADARMLPLGQAVSVIGEHSCPSDARTARPASSATPPAGRTDGATGHGHCVPRVVLSRPSAGLGPLAGRRRRLPAEASSAPGVRSASWPAPRLVPGGYRLLGCARPPAKRCATRRHPCLRCLLGRRRRGAVDQGRPCGAARGGGQGARHDAHPRVRVHP